VSPIQKIEAKDLKSIKAAKLEFWVACGKSGTYKKFNNCDIIIEPEELLHKFQHFENQ
jgi:NTE family protein